MMDLQRLVQLTQRELQIVMALRNIVAEEYALVTANALADRTTTQTARKAEMLTELSDCEKQRTTLWTDLLAKLDMAPDSTTDAVLDALGEPGAPLRTAVVALRRELPAYMAERAVLAETYQRAAGNVGLLWRFLSRAFGPQGILNERPRSLDQQV